MNAGDLKSILNVQKFVFNNGVYSWTYLFRLHSKKEVEYKKAFFSKLGFGTNEIVSFTVRFNRNISKHNSILHEGKHYLITSVTDIDNRHAYQKVDTVQITPKICVLKRLNSTKDNELNRPVKDIQVIYTFPGCIVEKYAKYDQEQVNSSISQTFILITPKEIVLMPGDLIVIDGITYNVQIPHTLDEYQNEYEIAIKKDVK